VPETNHLAVRLLYECGPGHTAFAAVYEREKLAARLQRLAALATPEGVGTLLALRPKFVVDLADAEAALGKTPNLEEPTRERLSALLAEVEDSDAPVPVPDDLAEALENLIRQSYGEPHDPNVKVASAHLLRYPPPTDVFELQLYLEDVGLVFESTWPNTAEALDLLPAHHPKGGNVPPTTHREEA